ncbi:uncharacterized protein LOC119398858 [Rhipicephalus sanguineus]|uniref:uncharacterized protein LOC119398858 n=1 Tax=Rhipicephalus sanguineus TaxID=34632 RepID=UPI0020C27102|nr:uncharacterized protein LOC119398858 [Rhipicephalus sanguineus]
MASDSAAPNGQPSLDDPSTEPPSSTRDNMITVPILPIVQVSLRGRYFQFIKDSDGLLAVLIRCPIVPCGPWCPTHMAVNIWPDGTASDIFFVVVAEEEPRVGGPRPPVRPVGLVDVAPLVRLFENTYGMRMTYSQALVAQGMATEETSP